MSSEALALAEGLARTGLYKTWTDYMIMGDEPVSESGNIYTGVVDLTTQMKPEDISKVKELFTYLPRMYLRKWFDETIAPTLKWDSEKQEYRFEKMLWGSFIELFNQANLDYVTRNNTYPWSWEEKKLDAFLLSQNNPKIQALNEKLAALAMLDPEAERLAGEYAKLPALGEPGLEINRQNAVKELLRMKEYDTVRSIIDAYKYAAQSSIGSVLSEPLPFTVNS